MSYIIKMAAGSKISLKMGGFISFLKVHAWDYACAKIGKACSV